MYVCWLFTGWLWLVRLRCLLLKLNLNNFASKINVSEVKRVTDLLKSICKVIWLKVVLLIRASSAYQKVYLTHTSTPTHGVPACTTHNTHIHTIPREWRSRCPLGFESNTVRAPLPLHWSLRVVVIVFLYSDSVFVFVVRHGSVRLYCIVFSRSFCVQQAMVFISTSFA